MSTNIPVGYDVDGNRLPFDRHYDIEKMLDEDLEYVKGLIAQPIERIKKISGFIDLRDKDWVEFWDEVARIRYIDLDLRYVSNCCGAEILEEVVDGTARCPECYEGCEAIKVNFTK
jgi:hypothetical protein